MRRGTTITVSGTTANDGYGGALHPGDTGAQTAAALRQALAAVEGLGGHVDDVVRTRIFLAPGADWRAASAAHAELLGDVRPANTMLFVHALIGDDFLVEVEVDAVVVDATDREADARRPSITSLRLNNDVPVDEFVELAQLAESLEFDQIWVSNDLFFRSAPVLLAAAAAATTDDRASGRASSTPTPCIPPRSP